MSEHYITAMTMSGPLIVAACRCGEMLAAHPDNWKAMFRQHLKEDA